MAESCLGNKDSKPTLSKLGCYADRFVDQFQLNMTQAKIKWRFEAKGKPLRSTLWQRKKLKRKLESYNKADGKRRPDVFNLEPVFSWLTQKL